MARLIKNKDIDKLKSEIVKIMESSQYKEAKEAGDFSEFCRWLVQCLIKAFASVAELVVEKGTFDETIKEYAPLREKGKSFVETEQKRGLASTKRVEIF